MIMKLSIAKKKAANALKGFMRAKEDLIKANDLIIAEQLKQQEKIEKANQVIDEGNEEFNANSRIIQKLNEFLK